MNGFEKTRNDIKAYVRSLNTTDNKVYQDNELLILSCFNKAMELIEENENLALGKPCVSGRSEQLKAFSEWLLNLSQEEHGWYTGRYEQVFLSL